MEYSTLFFEGEIINSPFEGDGKMWNWFDLFRLAIETIESAAVEIINRTLSPG